MESELMREPWTFPREPTSCVIAPHVVQAASQATAATAAASAPLTITLDEEPASTALSAWEENFQDLSGWCMSNVQPRCDFPTGESPMAAKLTGTRIEGSDVLTAPDGATRGFIQAIGRKIFKGGDAIVGARRPQQATGLVPPQLDHAYPLVGHQQEHQQQQMYFSNNNNHQHQNNNNSTGIGIGTKRISISNENSPNDNRNVWMGLPAKTEPMIIPAGNNNSVNWQELGDLGIVSAATGLPVYQQPATDLDVKPLHQMQRQDSQDVFRSFENEASPNFDLLSYLCEDDIPSPGDSVSTDSSHINNLPRLPSNPSAHIVVSPKTCEPISLSSIQATDPLKSRLQVSADSPYSHDSPKHSPISSASSELAMTSSSGRPYRQLRSIVKLETPESPTPIERRSSRPRRARTSSSTSRSSSSRGKGRKRAYDEDSDLSDDGSYRETREKNNEASRKSRMNKKAKEMEMSKRAVELEKDNRILKMKVEELEKLVSSMRNALLRSALKREVKPNMF
ncbi:uncharacterized protein LOC100122625 [Nasonia vitripennis]|uniref:BZIP domain-containing protein n=1 Tax=Nasonia vitripennis TaxID=7425 RepID=A0A7M7T935_NASVI|nr:uncharacterized protein LOC100122625 [Nasonia vitripennis]